MQGILDNYLSPQEMMESSSHGTDDHSPQAGGMLALMEKFQTDFGLKLAVLVFGITEHSSVTLQGVNTNANHCFAAVNVTTQGLTRHKSDEMFETFLELIQH